MTKTTDKKNDSAAAFVLAVAGAGKKAHASSVVYELAVALAISGLKVAMLESNLPAGGGAPSAAHGQSRWDLNKGVEQNLVHLTGGVELLPQAEQLTVPLSEAEKQAVDHALQWLEQRFDHILIHVPDGISHTALQLMKTAPNLLLVITPEPAALTDAFSLLRVLHSSGGRPRILVLTQAVPSRDEGAALYKRFETLVTVRLPVYMHHMGSLPPGGVETPDKVPVIMQDRHSPAGRALGHLALELETIRLESVPKNNLSQMWREATQEEKEQPVRAMVQTEEQLSRGGDLVQRCLEEIEAAWRHGEVERSDLQRIVERLEAFLEREQIRQAADTDLEGLRQASLEAAELARYDAHWKPRNT